MEDTVSFLMGEGVAENIARGAVTDSLKANAKAMDSAGLDTYVIREGHGCCAWCAEVAGTYPINEVPTDFWRVHKGCTCTIEYKARNKHTRISYSTDDKGRMVKNTENIVKNNPQNIENNTNYGKIKLNLQFFASKEKQYGKKIGKHAADFGLNAGNEDDRSKMMDIIKDIQRNKDQTRIGSWRGQAEEVLFHIKGNDAVVTKQDGEFVTVLKDGLLNNDRIKNARII